MLEDGSEFGDAPGGGAESSAASVGVGKAVDAPPSVLGLVVGLAVRGAGLHAETWVGVEPAAEGGDDEVVTVVLPGDFGSEVASPGTLEVTQVEWASRCLQRVSVSLLVDG